MATSSRRFGWRTPSVEPSGRPSSAIGCDDGSARSSTLSNPPPDPAYTWSSAESKQEGYLLTNSTSTYGEPSIEPASSDAPVSTSPVARAMRSVIRVYQRLTAGRPSPCRFYPSCSNYALEAIEAHGAVRGGWLAIRRLSRCRPLGPHGVDLVPEPKTKRSPH